MFVDVGFVFFFFLFPTKLDLLVARVPAVHAQRTWLASHGKRACRFPRLVQQLSARAAISFLRADLHAVLRG
jgi:hypothetical protein